MKDKLLFTVLSALATLGAGYGSLLALGFSDGSPESVTAMAWQSIHVVLPAGLAVALNAWFRYQPRLEQVLSTGKSALRWAAKVIAGAFVLYLPLLMLSLFLMLHSSDWLQTSGGLVQGAAEVLPGLAVLTLVVWTSALAVAFVPAFLLEWALCHFVIFRAIKARKQVKK